MAEDLSRSRNELSSSSACDADKIIALKSGDPPIPNAPETPRIQILDDGAIETDAVRTTITQIMEGGKEAFDLRTRKYHFDATR